MSSPTENARAAIPYERQDAHPDGELCGAAALCMVYRSFGIPCTQADVWPRIARPGAGGRRRARTRLLCLDALSQGLDSLIVQASQPWPLLTRCAALDCRVVLNHQPWRHAGEGHYSVLMGATDREVVVNDPLAGPGRRWSHDEFLALWAPASYEVPGNVLVAFARGRQPADPCGTCGQRPPSAIKCISCNKRIDLQPATVLGCVHAGCPGRLWEQVFCPACDWGMSAVPRGAGISIELIIEDL